MSLSELTREQVGDARLWFGTTEGPLFAVMCWGNGNVNGVDERTDRRTVESRRLPNETRKQACERVLRALNEDRCPEPGCHVPAPCRNHR